MDWYNNYCCFINLFRTVFTILKIYDIDLIDKQLLIIVNN